MTSEYIQYTCKTCGANSYTQAARAKRLGKTRILRCASGHQHAYNPEDTKSLQLEASPEIRKKLGLP